MRQNKRVIITKEAILNAIYKEPLRGDKFITSRFEPVAGIRVYDNLCQVCAVGAILRHSNIKNDCISDTGNQLTKHEDISLDGRIGPLLEKRKWLNAISVKFEKLYAEFGDSYKTKEKLSAFIKRNIPNKITINLNNTYFEKKDIIS